MGAARSLWVISACSRNFCLCATDREEGVGVQGYWLALTRVMDNEHALCRSRKEKKKKIQPAFWFSIKGLEGEVNKPLMVYGESD